MVIFAKTYLCGRIIMSEEVGMANKAHTRLAPRKPNLIRLFIEHNLLILRTLIVLVSLYVVASKGYDDQAKTWAFGSVTAVMGVSGFGQAKSRE